MSGYSGLEPAMTPIGVGRNGGRGAKRSASLTDAPVERLTISAITVAQ
jgi:hypothetical protein